eukprot:SAG31_NODE_682_length_12841_cov_13.637655_4_plen_196_part_00
MCADACSRCAWGCNYKQRKQVDQSNRNTNRGNKNVNINLNNKIILSRQKANLREVRRGLRGTESLKGVSTFNVPQTQSALLNNIMMSQFNNFKSELEQGQRQLQAERAAFEQRAQQLNQIVANVTAPLDETINVESTQGSGGLNFATPGPEQLQQQQINLRRALSRNPENPTSARASLDRQFRQTFAGERSPFQS